ncbi:MAG: hypothetical protein QOG53_759 [Frankiales bacterium]|nr:hypothetical protein [Frankiales bacterium]
MADDVPAKKAAAKKTTAKKTTAKKASAKKAPAKRATTTRAVAKQAPEETVVLPAAPETPAEPPPPATDTAAAPESLTAVERVLQLDWASTARIAVPSLLALIAAACVALTTLLMFDNHRGDISIGPQARPPVGDFFKFVAMVSAMALNSSIRFKGGHVSLMPLTLTALVLVVYAGLTRRYLRQGSTADTLGRLLRASLLFAVLATVVSVFGRFSFGGRGDRAKISVSPGQTFVWGFLLTAAVGALVVYGPVLVARARADERVWARLRVWRLPLQGGLVALAAAIALGGLAFIIAAFVEISNNDGNVLDVVRALPIIFGFFINIGVTVAALAMGDTVSGEVGAFGSGGNEKFGYADLQGAADGYFLMLLLPVVATLIGINWMLRHRQDENVRDLSRACYRMAVPFALGWFFLAIPTRVEIGAGGVAGAHIGPDLFLGLVLALGWPGVIGAIYGQWLLRRGETAPLPASRSARRIAVQFAWLPITIAALLVIGATTVAAAVRHQDVGRSTSFGSIFSGEVGDQGVAPAPRYTQAPPTFSVPPIPVPTLSPIPDRGRAQASSLLYQASFAQRSYQARNGRYTTDESELGILTPPDVTLDIASADATRFCMTARADNGTAVYSYDSDVGRVVDGDSC